MNTKKPCRRFAAGHSASEEILETDSASNLPITWEGLVSGFSKCPAVQVILEVEQVYAIEDVKEFEPQLENESFSKVRVFVDIYITLKEVRPAERRNLLVAFSSQRGNGELAP